MTLFKNRNYQYMALAAALMIGGCFCAVSGLWSVVFACVLVPLLLGNMLRQYLEDHDFSQELREDYAGMEQ